MESTIFILIILFFVIMFFIGPLIINIGMDTKQRWTDYLGGIFVLVFWICGIFILKQSSISSEYKGIIFIALPVLYALYIYIFRYLIYIVLRFLIIKPIILLDSSMTAKIEQNKNAIKNNQNDQNNP